MWGFPDKITFCEITINRNSWGAHGKKCGALRRMERHRIGLNRTTCISWFGVYYWVSRRYSKQLNAGYVKKWVTWLSLYLLTGYESTLSSVVPISGCSVFLSDHALRKQSSPVTISSYVWLKWSWPATRSPREDQKASSDAGPESAGRVAVRRWKARRPWCAPLKRGETVWKVSDWQSTQRSGLVQHPEKGGWNKFKIIHCGVN